MERKSFKLISSEGLLENTNIANKIGESDSPEIITVDYLRRQIIQLLSSKEGCLVAHKEISESLQIDSSDETEVEPLRITFWIKHNLSYNQRIMSSNKDLFKGVGYI